MDFASQTRFLGAGPGGDGRALGGKFFKRDFADDIVVLPSEKDFVSMEGARIRGQVIDGFRIVSGDHIDCSSSFFVGAARCRQRYREPPYYVSYHSKRRGTIISKYSLTRKVG